MSMSDVVVLSQDGENQAYYVDSFGFQKVPEFLETQQTGKEHEAVIHEGKVSRDAIGNKRASVLGRLQEKKNEAGKQNKQRQKPEKFKRLDRS